MSRDEGPVYYREIQKNAYLKRIPNDVGGKLRPLGGKKPALKPMWTLFCVHNGRLPYLEQYTDADSPATVTHRPLWRACLITARHVTASVKPHCGEEYDFLVDCDQGPVRMVAPDWDSMLDWVSTLRSKLHELKVLSRGENVYCAPPVQAPPRAPARDPTSPLPPTPPVPVPRVPGIELTPQATRNLPEPESQPVATALESQPQPVAADVTQPLTDSSVDISNWEAASDADSFIGPNPSLDPSESLQEQPSTSVEKESKETKRSVAKICGQNICLDDSILKRSTDRTDSDEEFFAEIDRINDSIENLQFDERTNSYIQDGYKQTLMVDGERPTTSESQSDQRPSNITVIKVSNKPPHTAIPVMGPETNVFDFSFKQHLTVNSDKHRSKTDDFVNIVNTEVNVDSNIANGYGTVFNKEPDYGHISLTTTVSLTGDVNVRATDVRVGEVKAIDVRVGDVKVTDVRRGDVKPTDVAVGEFEPTDVRVGDVKVTDVRMGDVKVTDVRTTDVKVTDGIYERLCLASTSKDATSPLPVRIRNLNLDKSRKSSLPNLDTNTNESTYEYLCPNSQNNTNITLNSTESTILINSTRNTDTKLTRHGNIGNSSTEQRYITSNTGRNTSSNGTRSGNGNTSIESQQTTSESRTNSDAPRIANSNEVTRQNSHGNVTVNHRSTPVERSHSQNAFDRSRMREYLVRRVQNNSPKREAKNEKTECPSKPIWKRGLTELSLLSRLRGIGQRRQESPTRRQESPTRHTEGDRNASSPVKVVHRSRPEGRTDGSRRRSSSLNNGQSPPPAPPALQPLRERQASALRADQRRGATPTAVPKRDPPLFVDYNRQVWVAHWGVGGSRCGGRAGDRVACVACVAPLHATHARHCVKHAQTNVVDILFHRVPLAKIHVLNKRDLEPIGIKLDSECNITGIEPGSPAARAGLPPPGRWAVTEVNNRPINIVKGGEEEMNRLSLHGTEASILIQPSPLVKKIRSAIKNKALFK